MPSRKTTQAAAAATARMPPIPEEPVDRFVTVSMSAKAPVSMSAIAL